jgi:hypothetical protein
MTFQHKQQLRSCPRGTHNTPAAPPKKRDFLPNESTPPKENPLFLPNELKSSKENPLFPFPRWTDPIPDALIDYTELWKVVSMAKPLPDAAKSNQVGSKGGSNKGTTAYDDVLYRLGIDIETTTEVNKPEYVNIDGLPPQSTVQYSHLSTHEQLYALAEQYKRYGRKLNKATLAARLMSDLFIFADIPDPDNPDSTVVPCQTLKLTGTFTNFDRFNKSLYSYVRGPRPRGIQPHESELRYRSDLTIMAYNNAVSCGLRDHSGDFPGVHNSYDAVAPFFSAEFKPDDSPTNQREATHQIAISSYINLVERQRLRRLYSGSIPYTQDKNIRHYAYTICGTKVTVWVTRLQIETARSRSFTTYKVQKLAVLNLRGVAGLEEFLEWHRRIVTWGLGVYVVSYVRDLENAIGAPRRESLLRLIMTEKEVTAPVQSMDLGESAEQEEIEQVETEQEETEQATEQADTEQAETEQAETEQEETEQETEQATEQVDKRPLSLHPTRSGIPSAPVGGSRAHGTFHNRFHYMLYFMSPHC